jgi:hypothetical protein
MYLTAVFIQMKSLPLIFFQLDSLSIHTILLDCISFHCFLQHPACDFLLIGQYERVKKNIYIYNYKNLFENPTKNASLKFRKYIKK